MKKIGSLFLKYKILFIIFFSISCLFFILFKFVYTVDYNNLSGTHSWLTGSTVKFVNNWLKEGPVNLHFTNYESPNSIEFKSLSDRGPYLSYPTGSTFIVYTAAKFLGKDQIGASFVKRFNMLSYYLGSVLISILCYCVIKSKVKKKSILFLIPFCTAALWILLPNNVYYLSNIYFADQSVILWAIAFFLFEFIHNSMEKKSRSRLAIGILKSIILFIGFMIDYYVWIIAFVAFVFNLIKSLIKKDKFSNIIKSSLYYIVPVVLGLILFYIQVQYTNNWVSLIQERFLFRVSGAAPNGSIKNLLLNNFTSAFANDTHSSAMLLIIMIGFNIYYLFHRQKISKKNTDLFLSPFIYTYFLILFSTLLQIIFLKNHSAIHEFSMLKFGMLIVMTLILGVFIELNYPRNKNSYITNYFVSLFTLSCITGIPSSINNYYEARYYKNEHFLEQIISEKTDYFDVCFSFSYEIAENPPQELAISKKRVYKIEKMEDIKQKFPDLSENAKKVFIIKKDFKDISSEQKKTEDMLQKNSNILFEDEYHVIIRLK